MVKTDGKQKKKDVKVLPEIRDKKGNLLKLKRADFPYNKKGICAFCDYKVESWKAKKTEMLKMADPVNKLEKKRTKLADALKLVEAEINAEKTSK